MSHYSQSDLINLLNQEKTKRPFSLEKIARAVNAEHLLKNYGSNYKDLLIKRFKPKKITIKKCNEETPTPQISPLGKRIYYNNLNDNVSIIDLHKVGFHYPFTFRPTIMNNNYQTRNRKTIEHVTSSQDTLIKSELMNDLFNFTKKVGIGSYALNGQEYSLLNYNYKDLQKSLSTELNLQRTIIKSKSTKTSLLGSIVRLNKKYLSQSDSLPIPNKNLDLKNQNLKKQNSTLPLLFITTAPEKKNQKAPSANNNIMEKNSKISINCIKSRVEENVSIGKIIISNKGSKSFFSLNHDASYNRIKQLDQKISNILRKEK